MPVMQNETPNASELIPRHVAIIMDGNGRWAKKRFMPRVAGHRAGVDATRKIVKHCIRQQVGILTLFAFSSENWQRPAEEVSFLMDLLLSGLEKEVPELNKNKVQLRFIGNRTRFSDKLRDKINDVETLTRHNAGMVLVIAADYGGQWDICQAAQKLAAKVEAGCLATEAISPELLRSELSLSDLPDPDLFIRTSGEIRISNFMLWQLAYSELYFTQTLWPDFNEQELDQAFAAYASRERRYGKSGEQLSEIA